MTSIKRGKHDIPHVSDSEIREILRRAFPALNDDFGVNKITFSEGNLNLVYRLDIQHEIRDVPKSVVLKVSNSAWGPTKVLNEVVVTRFLRKYFEELKLCDPSYVPLVYDYRCGNEEIHYMLVELVPGVILSDYYTVLHKTGNAYQDQLAQFWAAMKCFQLEDQKIGQLASLELVDRGRLIVRAKYEPDFDSGVPVAKSFKEWVLSVTASRLKEAEALASSDPDFYNNAISQTRDLLGRLQKSSFLDKLDWGKRGPLGICHGDIRWQNIMIDPETSTLTGIIDWESACINTCHFEQYMVDFSEEVPFPHKEIKERFDVHWHAIAEKFPLANLTDYNPFPSGDDDLTKGRFLSLFFVSMARYIARAHEWHPIASDFAEAKKTIFSRLKYANTQVPLSCASH